MSSEIELGPRTIFIISMVICTMLAIGVVRGLGNLTESGIIGSKYTELELWDNGVRLEENKLFGMTRDFGVMGHSQVEVRNPTSSAKSFSFTYETYPSNLNVSVNYSHFTPFVLQSGGSLLFGMDYWVLESNVSISDTDIWFNLVGG